ncbi:MAG: DUF2339 domain-containing protein [Planctomycetota bacterium]
MSVDALRPDGDLERRVHELTGRVDELTERLVRLESRGVSVAPAKPVVPAPVLHAPVEPVPAPLVGLPKPARFPVEGQPAKAGAWYEDADKRRQDPSIELRQIPVPKAGGGVDLEWLLGARGLAAAGMVIVVVGIGMFLKLAYDSGWLAAISPAMRCAGAGAFGAVLLVIGEVLRRRVNPLASSGVSGTGLAVMYAGVLAASRVFGLLDGVTTFGLLAAVTVLGVFLGALSGRVMLALLSLAGAFLTPLMLQPEGPSLVALPLYLFALLVLGLVLAGWKGGAYSRVRRLAWWGTTLMGTGWLVTIYNAAPAYGLVFVGLVWLATVIELFVSARFFGRLRDRTAWPKNSSAGFRRDGDEIRFEIVSLLSPEARWLNSVFGATAWAAVAGALLIREVAPGLEYIAPMALALMGMAVAIVVQRMGGPGSLWPTDPTPRSALISALVLDAAMLVVAAVLMGLGGWAQVVTWCALGFAAVETSRRVRFRAVGVFGLLLLVVALVRLVVTDSQWHLGGQPALSVLGFAFTPWSAQLALVALAAAAVAIRSSYVKEKELAACMALWLSACSLFHPATEAASLGPAMVWLGVLVAWLSSFLKTRTLRSNAICVAAVGAGVAVLGSFVVTDFMFTSDQPRIDALSLALSALGWVAIAALGRLTLEQRIGAAAMSVVLGTFAVSSVVQSRGLPDALLAGLAYAFALVVGGRWLWRWGVTSLSAIPMTAVLIGWAIERISTGGRALDGMPVWNQAFLTVVSLVVVLAWFARSVTSRGLADDADLFATDGRRLMRNAAMVLVWLVSLVGSSIEIQRAAGQAMAAESAMGAALSIWCGLFGITSIAMGFRLGAALRYAGLTLMAFVMGKVLLVDTQVLSDAARIIASISVGLTTIGGGVLYARFADRFKG